MDIEQEQDFIDSRVNVCRMIQRLANEAIEILKQNPRKFEESVAWSRVHCSQVMSCIDNDGDLFYVARIADAHPGAYNFLHAINEYLAKHGYLEIQVEALW